MNPVQPSLSEVDNDLLEQFRKLMEDPTQSGAMAHHYYRAIHYLGTYLTYQLPFDVDVQTMLFPYLRDIIFGVFMLGWKMRDRKYENSNNPTVERHRSRPADGEFYVSEDCTGINRPDDRRPVSPG